jgi:GTP-binding protein Era
MTQDTSFVSGFVAVLGRPNVGKSTLINTFLGEKVSIVSPKPQTTRHRIHGMLNLPEAQIVLVDTPGFCKEASPLHRAMRKSAGAAAADADVNLVVCDIGTGRDGDISEADHEVLRAAKACGSHLLLALNKIDLLARKDALLPWMARYAEAYAPTAMVPVCARSGDGFDELVQQLLKVLPQAPAMFPKDMHTDQAERFICAELIREQLLYQTHEEVPHTCMVTIEAFEDGRADEDEPKDSAAAAKHTDRCYLEARIYVERDSQKGIIIGKRGQQIKSIGTVARQRIGQLLGCRVDLRLTVHVDDNWTQKEQSLRRYGFYQEAQHA